MRDYLRFVINQFPAGHSSRRRHGMPIVDMAGVLERNSAPMKFPVQTQ